MHKIKRYARKEIVYIKAKQNVCVDLFFSFYCLFSGGRETSQDLPLTSMRITVPSRGSHRVALFGVTICSILAVRHTTMPSIPIYLSHADRLTQTRQPVRLRDTPISLRRRASVRSAGSAARAYAANDAPSTSRAVAYERFPALPRAHGLRRRRRRRFASRQR